MTRKPSKPAPVLARKPAPRALAAAAAAPPRKGGPLVAARRTGTAATKSADSHKAETETHKADTHKAETHKAESHKKVAPVASAVKAAPAANAKEHGKENAALHKKSAAAAPADAPVRRHNGLPEDRQSQLKLLIARGKEQGYLTYAQVNDHLPAEIVDPEQIEGIVNTINDMGIPVYEKAPDNESLLANEPAPADDEAIEEAAAALAALDAELGRTTDPVRMYMREMGTVELLTREGEIRIAKRIEEGLDAVRVALAKYPATHDHILKTYELVKAGQARLIDLVVGFIDPNAPDVIAQPQNPTKLLEIEAATDDKEDDADDGEEDEEEAVDTGPDPEEVARRMGRSRNCRCSRWHRLPSPAPKIPRPRNCARSWPASSWNSSSRRACSMP
jgi:hypothetical protein